MFYEELTVNIPQKKRIKVQGGCRYVYEILSRKTKTTVEKVVTVGKAIDDTTMHPNEKYYEIHNESINDKPLPEPSIFDSRLSIGEYMVVDKIINILGLQDAINETFEADKGALIKALLCYTLDRQDGAYQLLSHYLFDHYCGINYIPSNNKITNLYRNYFTPDKISSFISHYYNNYLINFTNGFIDINYDSTNYNTSSKNITAAEYGKAKLDEGLPQFNVAYLVDRNSGIPIYYDFYYGSIIDNSHCKIILDKITSINKKVKASFIMDRGYFSRNNLEMFIENDYYFSCMGKEGIALSKLIDKHPISNIDNPRNSIKNGIYGIKDKGKPFDEFSREVYLYLFFDSHKNETMLESEQNKINYMCSKLVGKDDSKGDIRKTYGEKIIIKVKRNKIIEATPNFDYLDLLKKEAGYFFIVSNEDLNPSEILEHYRTRDTIEKDFSYSKTGSGLRKTFANNDVTAESRTFIGFLSSIIRSSLINTLKPFFKQYSLETSNTVFAELNKIKIQKINDKYILDCALTNKQKQILSFYDMNQKNVYEIIKEKNEIPES